MAEDMHAAYRFVWIIDKAPDCAVFLHYDGTFCTSKFTSLITIYYSNLAGKTKTNVKGTCFLVLQEALSERCFTVPTTGGNMLLSPIDSIVWLSLPICRSMYRPLRPFLTSLDISDEIRLKIVRESSIWGREKEKIESCRAHIVALT